MTLLNHHDNLCDRAPWPGAAADVRGLLEVATSAAVGVPVDVLHAPSRCAAPIAFARQSAIYLAHVVLGLNYTAAGRLFGRDRTTAAHACQRVEERRDDPAIDGLLEMLERLCRDGLADGAAAVRP
jgi:hypothetical protein